MFLTLLGRYLFLVTSIGFLFFLKPSFSENFINPSELPRILYIAIHYSDPSYRQLDLKRKRLVDKLIEENLKLSLYSKGYKVKEIRKVIRLRTDYLLRRFHPTENEGILAVDIKELTFTYAVVGANYKVAGKAILMKNDGTVLGTWNSEATKGEVNIPMSLGDIAKLFLSAVTYNADNVIYNIVQIFARKLTMQIPDLPESVKMVKVFFVNWFIGDPKTAKVKEHLKRGDTVSVLIQAQPGLEGELILNGLNGGKKVIGISHAKESPQVYLGSYKFRINDKGEDVIVKVRLKNKYGDTFEVQYPEYLQVDAVPPLPPVNLKAEVLGSGVNLHWDVLRYDADFDHFEIYKRTNEQKDWVLIAKTREKQFMDKDIKEGNYYLYKVVSVDRYGNISEEDKSPIAEVVVPLKHVVNLENTELKGSLKPATYLIGNNVKIPKGGSLFVKYSKLVFLKPLTVEGELVAEKTEFNGNPNDILYSEKVYPLSNCLVVDGGKVALNRAKFRECKTAIFVKRGTLKGNEIVFRNNRVNVISYEPTTVVLNKVDFGTTKVSNFRLRGKLIVKSLLVDGKEVVINPNIQLYPIFQKLVVTKTQLGDLLSVKEVYKNFTPLFVNADIYKLEDKKLIELCKHYQDTECLIDYLPALIKLYPDDDSFVLDYITVLSDKEACNFLKRFLKTHQPTPRLKEAENIKCGGR
jgi:hypothetical protein